MEKTYSITLYISTASPGNVVFDAVQGDTGRKIQATILNDDGTAFSPGTGTTAEYWSVKSDKNGTQHSATISGNVVIVQLTVQDLAVPGRTYAAIVLKNGDTILAAMPFWFMVVPIPVGNDIESTSEYQMIEEATEAAEEAAENANNAAEHGPQISESNQHWMIWDNDTSQYVDTGVPATGAEGVVLYSAAQTLTTEQKAQARSNIGAGAAADIGTLSSLTTADKTDLVAAINEVDGHADTNATAITAIKAMISDEYSSSATYKLGDLCIHDNTLQKCTTPITTAEAWNSAHWADTTIADEIENRCLFFTGVTVSATTGTILSKSDSRITADHVLTNIVFNNTAAITTECTWTTDAGSLTITGTCTTATTADITLIKKNN